MTKPGNIFQSISVRRKVVISIGMMMVLITAIGLFVLAAIAESNKRLQASILEARTMAGTIDAARLSQVHFKKQVQEWKNILLRWHEKDLFDKHMRAFIEEERKTNEYLKLLSRISFSHGLTVPQIAGVIDAHENLGKQYREALAAYRPLNYQNAARIDKSVRGIDRKLTDDIDAIVDITKNLTDQKLKETEFITQTQMNAYHALSFFIIFLVIAAVFFGIFNTFSIIKELPREDHENGTDVEEES